MKKLMFSLAVLGLVLALASCNKSKNDGTNTQVTQGVSFSIKAGSTPGGLKSDCFSTNASYAKVFLNIVNANGSTTPYPGNPIKVDIFYLAGQPYTNSIQLAPGTYALADFVMYNDMQTPNNEADDQTLAAAPHSGSAYAPYVVHPLSFNFTVVKFSKLQVPVECVCYQPSHWTDFGFVFFLIHDITLREIPFFGDLCAKDYAKYIGSDYAKQRNGGPLQPDMPAIFKIDVLRNDTAVGSFTNDSLSLGWGEGAPRKVRYADRAWLTDHFEFRLSVLVRTGLVSPAFSFVYFKSWYATDAGPVMDNDLIPPAAADKDGNGVIDFTLGYCNPNADCVLPPYIVLPVTCTYTITAVAPGTTKGGYVDAALVVPSGDYELQSTTYASYCVETDFFITVGQTYNMNVFSSLYPSYLPSWGQSKPWDKINWLINHLDWFPGYQWNDVQGAIWEECGWNGTPSEPYVTYPTASCSCLAWTMITDMEAYGSGYKVPTGGWACVVFIDKDHPELQGHTQTMFIKVDP